MAVSVKLPGNTVEHYLLKAIDNRIALENSNNKFCTVHQLIAHYCTESDEIPVLLKIPNLVAEATSRQQLRSLALLGQEFWSHTSGSGKELSSPSDADLSKNFVSSGLGSGGSQSSSSQNSLNELRRPLRPTTLDIANFSVGCGGVSTTSPPPVPPRWSRSTLLTPLSLPSSIQSTPSEIQSTFSEKSGGHFGKKKKRNSGGKQLETPSIHYKDTEILDLFKGTKTTYDDKMSDYEELNSPYYVEHGKSPFSPPRLSTFKPDLIASSIASDLDKSHTQNHFQSQSLSYLVNHDIENNKMIHAQNIKNNNNRTSLNGNSKNISPPSQFSQKENKSNNRKSNGLYSEPIDSIAFRRLSPHRHSEPNIRWSQPMLSLVQMPDTDEIMKVQKTHSTALQQQQQNNNTMNNSITEKIGSNNNINMNQKNQVHRSSLANVANVNVNVNIVKNPTVVSKNNHKNIGCASVDNLCHLRDIKKRAKFFNCGGRGNDTGSADEDEVINRTNNISQNTQNLNNNSSISKNNKSNVNKEITPQPQPQSDSEQIIKGNKEEIINVTYKVTPANKQYDDSLNKNNNSLNNGKTNGNGTVNNNFDTNGNNITMNNATNTNTASINGNGKRRPLDIDKEMRKEEREMLDISNNQSWRLDNSWEFVMWDGEKEQDEDSCSSAKFPLAPNNSLRPGEEKMEIMENSNNNENCNTNTTNIISNNVNKNQGLRQSNNNLNRFSRYDNLDGGRTDEDEDENDGGGERDEISQPWDSSKWEHLLKLVSESTSQLDSIQMAENNVNLKQRNNLNLYRPGESSDLSSDEKSVKNSIDSRQRVSKIIEVTGNEDRAGKAISSVVRELAEKEGVFGPTLKSFISCTVSGKSKEPSKVMRNIRQFITGMKNYLVGVSSESEDLRKEIKKQTELLSDTEFLNIDAILEEVLIDLVISPLNFHIRELIEAKFNQQQPDTSDGRLSIENNRNMNLITFARGNLEKQEILESLHKIYRNFEESISPIMKLDKWNQFVCNVQDMEEDYSSDSFLPLLTEMLAAVCTNNLPCHIDYMIGLLPHSIVEQNNYSISLLQCTVAALKTRSEKEKTLTSVRVIIPDERNGTLIRKMVPVRKTTTNKEVAKMVASKLGITNPHDYILVSIKNGQEKLCPESELVTQCVEDNLTALAYKRIDAKIGWPQKI